MALEHISVAPLPIERFDQVLTEDQLAQMRASVDQAAGVLAGKVVWNVNSTRCGGGVAELLQSLIGYSRGAGIDARWMVMEGDPDFFRVTKRIHNQLHGAAGDGGGLGEPERRAYEAATQRNAAELLSLVRPGDFMLLHDPQTAGLVALMEEAGVHVIWRCHVGLDQPNELAREAWSFLRPYVEPADAYVFSRDSFAWSDLDESRVSIIPPSIDAFSPKNQSLDHDTRQAILRTTGLVQDGRRGNTTFVTQEGTPNRVDRRAELIEEAPTPQDAQLLVQVSRWDRLKDPIGVLDAFADSIAPRSEAHLMVAGPAVAAVSDDPEGLEVLNEVERHWRALPKGPRARIHLACLPMVSAQENAAIVNALQRHADVVAQKSLAEGFGLTVAEAMWKTRPVVASNVGGIADQIVDGESGLLVDPRDLDGFGDAVSGLLADRQRAKEMGAAAHERVRADFLGPRHLGQYVDLFARIAAGGAAA